MALRCLEGSTPEDREFPHMTGTALQADPGFPAVPQRRAYTQLRLQHHGDACSRSYYYT
ncbi:MAG: hypothetical protein ACI4B5_02320 [Bacteroidaceae bacterium]